VVPKGSLTLADDDAAADVDVDLNYVAYPLHLKLSLTLWAETAPDISMPFPFNRDSKRQNKSTQSGYLLNLLQVQWSLPNFHRHTHTHFSPLVYQTICSFQEEVENIIIQSLRRFLNFFWASVFSERSYCSHNQFREQ
jgi:hypothetical protein